MFRTAARYWSPTDNLRDRVWRRLSCRELPPRPRPPITSGSGRAIVHRGTNSAKSLPAKNRSARSPRRPTGKCFARARPRAGTAHLFDRAARLGIDRSIHPIVPRLVAHLTRGLMPIEVRGEVEWLVNPRRTAGW